ncbi:hypothetical protein M1328_00710 [Patescibacteria group bacterium]|nr:hypothetical protein [Patescibacteria group bacterium]
MRKAFFLNILLTVFLFVFTTSVFARSGCCSWHGGVAGCDTNVGRQVCNDGTYSPSCTCAYIPRLPTPTPIIIPESIKGGPTYQYNDVNKSYDVTFDWDDWSQSSGWSVGLSQYAGGDPGPNMDTTTSVWIFKNVYPGTHYVNIKASVGGYWSRVSYWTINVPAIPTPTPTPTNTPTPTITPTPSPTKVIKQETKNKTQTINKKTFWQWLINLINGK